jgi:hypothetical protein
VAIILEVFAYCLLLLFAALLVSWIGRGIIYLFKFDPWQWAAYKHSLKKYKHAPFKAQPKP